MDDLKAAFFAHLESRKDSDNFDKAKKFGIGCYAHDVGRIIMLDWLAEWEKNNEDT